MKKKNLQESTAFISQNMNILTSQVPEEFLHSWVVPNLDTYFEESENHKTEFSVFMYALTKYYSNKGLSEFEKSPQELITLFNDYQAILILCIATKHYNIPLEPFKLFDFDGYESLNIELNNPNTNLQIQ